jgi:hypothetical protein
MHDITQPRMRKSLKYELEMLKLIVGKRNFKYVLLVLTKWGDPTRNREFESRQYDLEDNYWEDLLRGGASVHKFEGSPESARSIVAQLNFGENVVLALQKELAERPDVPFKDTTVGRYAQRTRNEQQAELLRLANDPRKKQAELQIAQKSLERAKSDTKNEDIKLHEQVKALIKSAVEEELKKTKTKPSVSKVMTWVSKSMTTLFRAPRAGPTMS